MDQSGKWVWPGRIQYGGLYCQGCLDSQQNERGCYLPSSCLKEQEGKAIHWRRPGSFDVMRWLLVLLLTCHIGLGVTANIPMIPVTVRLNPESIGPDEVDVELTCEYTISDSSLSYLQWGGQYKMYTYSREKGELDSRYSTRVVDWETITNQSHHMVLKNADWCADLETYTCQVYTYPPSPGKPADQGQNGRALTARTDVNEIQLDGKNFSDNKSLKHPANVTVTCSSTYIDTSVNVSIKIEGFDVDGKPLVTYETGTAEKTGDSCNHQASVEATFPVLENGKVVYVTCTSEVNGVNTTIADRRMIAVGDVATPKPEESDDEVLGLSKTGGGCNKGCVGGSIGGTVAVITGVAVAFMAVKRSKRNGERASLNNCKEVSNGQTHKIGVADISGPYPSNDV